MLAIRAEWLTGEYIAQTHEYGPEWPPHPVRLLYALIESWHEGDCDSYEEAALRWMEQAEPPVVATPPVTDTECYQAYVPMGGKQHKNTEPPTWARKPKMRASTRIDDQPVRFIWNEEPRTDVVSGLTSLCKRCARLGCAGSFVRLTPERVDRWPARAWRPTSNEEGTTVLRVPTPGTIEASQRISPTYPGRVYPHELQSYARRGAAEPARSVWLGIVGDGPAWPIERGPALARAVRRALIETGRRTGEPARPVLHGHNAEGGPLDRDHIRIWPLPNVGRTHASGRVLGVAIITPTNTGADDADHVLRLAAAWLGTGGRASAEEQLTRFEPADRRHTLQEVRWSKRASVWQTVIPLELDRHVQSSTAARRRGWNPKEWDRAAELVKQAALREGLPPPAKVELSRSPFTIGSPHVVNMQREQHRRKPLIHARLYFETPVRGPAAIGRGRHIGYGLMEPVGGTQ